MKNINHQAPVVCHSSIFIEASLKIVWKILMDINCWTAWQPNITQSKLLGPLQPQTDFEWKMNGIRIRSTLCKVKKFQKLIWTGKSIGTFAIHQWTLIPKDGGVIVETTESLEGWIAILFKKSILKNLEKGLEEWLEHLKQECEKR